MFLWTGLARSESQGGSEVDSQFSGKGNRKASPANMEKDLLVTWQDIDEKLDKMVSGLGWQ